MFVPNIRQYPIRIRTQLSLSAEQHMVLSGLSLFLVPQLLVEFNFSPQIRNRLNYTPKFLNHAIVAPGLV